jgi:hypothetical protein
MDDVQSLHFIILKPTSYDVVSFLRRFRRSILSSSIVNRDKI